MQCHQVEKKLVLRATCIAISVLLAGHVGGQSKLKDDSAEEDRFHCDYIRRLLFIINQSLHFDYKVDNIITLLNSAHFFDNNGDKIFLVGVVYGDSLKRHQHWLHIRIDWGVCTILQRALLIREYTDRMDRLLSLCGSPYLL